MSGPSWEETLSGFDLRRVAPRPVRRGSASAPEDEVLAAALASAGLEAFLSRASAARETVTVVVNDPHRPTRTDLALATVLAVRARLGGEAPALRIVVAAGSHRAEQAEREAHLGPIRAALADAGLGPEAAPITWHDATDAASLAPVGPFRLQRDVAAARFVLAIGSLEPHYFAGVTGAHKTLSIGVLARDEIEANHAAALEPGARPLALDGNPVHAGIVAIVDALAAGRELFAVNELIVGGRVVAATAGEPLAALREAVPLVREVAAVATAPVDLVVSQVEPPLDRSLYQADKGIKNVEAAVRRGGAIVLEAACLRGVGIDRFVRLLERAATLEAARRVVAEEGYRLGDHKAVRLRALTDPAARDVAVGAITPGVSEATLRAIGLTPLRDRAAAAEWLAERPAAAVADGVRPTGLVVADAGNLVLEVSS